MKKYLLLLMIFICSFSFSAEPVDFKVKLVKGEVFPEFVLEKLSGTKELSTEVFDKNKKTLYIMLLHRGIHSGIKPAFSPVICHALHVRR